MRLDGGRERRSIGNKLIRCVPACGARARNIHSVDVTKSPPFAISDLQRHMLADADADCEALATAEGQASPRTLQESRGTPSPPWLARVEACGTAVSAASNAATEAAVVVAPCAEPTSTWVAQCLALERRIFPPHEAMDIADQVRTRGVTLLCASPMTEWVGIHIGPSVGPGTCVGYAILQRSETPSSADADSLLIAKLAVAPALRRRGVGRALLAAAISHARATRAGSCTLHMDVTNAPARALYTSLGFTPRGDTLFDFYRPGRHATEMALQLAPPPAAASPSRTEPDCDSQSQQSAPRVGSCADAGTGTEVEELD